MVNFILGAASYTLIDDGLANLLAVETLAHGTNPISYVKIRLEGGGPAYGGKSSNHPHAKDYFFLLKESEMRLENFTENERCLRDILSFGDYLIPKRILPRLFATISGFKFMANLIPEDKSPYIVIKITKIFIGILGGFTSFLLSPTIKFRFDKIDSKRLENDEDMWGIAYKTRQKIEPWRIGMLGTLLTGINSEWFSRVQKQPSKAIKGFVLLTAGIALTIFTFTTTPTSLTNLAVGALLA